MLKSAGKTRPMAASSRTSRVRFSTSTSETVSTPVSAAATTSSGDAMFSVTKNASTIPSRMAWLMASLISDIRRSTRNTPGRAQAAAVTAAIHWISCSGIIRRSPLSRLRAAPPPCGPRG